LHDRHSLKKGPENSSRFYLFWFLLEAISDELSGKDALRSQVGAKVNWNQTWNTAYG
jgi:hypothetical protein